MRLLCLCLAGLGLFALLAKPFILNQVVVDSDLGRAHLPERDFYQRCLQSGDEFYWCPHLFCGYSLHAEGQGGFDHPLHRLLYSSLPLVPAFNLEVFLSYPFLLVGTYLLMRRHALPREAALFGGLALTFSGFTLPHYPHTNGIAIVAHIPWLLWATDVLWRAESPRTEALAGAAIGLLTASQLLLGYPQYVYFSALAEVVYIACLLHADRSWLRFGHWALAKILGTLAGGAQLLPTLEALFDSPRMGYTKEFRGSLSLHPGHLGQLVAPTAFNEFMQLHEYTVYAGGLATLGLVWLFVRPNSQRLGVLGRWAMIAVLIAVPLALGRFTPLFRLYLKLPIVGVFRCPCRYLVLAHFAAAVLVAGIIRDLVRSREPLSWRRLRWLAIVPLMAWLAVVARPAAGEEMSQFLTDGSTIWIGASVITALTVLLIAAARGQRWAIPVLMMAALTDQGYYGLRSLGVYRYASLDEYVARETAPPGLPVGRVVLGDVHGNALMVRDTPLTNGYVGLSPTRRLDYSKPEVQRLAGTVWKHDGDVWHRMTDPLPRLRLVTDAQVSVDPSGDLGEVDAARVALVEREIDLQPGVRGALELVRDRPGDVLVRTSASTRRLLVFAESFHRSWTATVDGRPVEVLRAYGDFQACFVPAGEHQVAFRFVPAAVTWGRRMSWLGLTAIIATAAMIARRRRKRMRTPAIDLLAA